MNDSVKINKEQIKKNSQNCYFKNPSINFIYVFYKL